MNGEISKDLEEWLDEGFENFYDLSYYEEIYHKNPVWTRKGRKKNWFKYFPMLNDDTKVRAKKWKFLKKNNYIMGRFWIDDLFYLVFMVATECRKMKEKFENSPNIPKISVVAINNCPILWSKFRQSKNYTYDIEEKTQDEVFVEFLIEEEILDRNSEILEKVNKRSQIETKLDTSRRVIDDYIKI